MAKVSKIAAGVPSLAADRTLIVADFAARYNDVEADGVRAALLRRCGDKESFNAIRICATAAWLVRVHGYTLELATANMDKTLQNPNGIIKTKQKRTPTQQSNYKTANAHWSDYLALYEIETLNASKARTGKRAPRTPNGANVTPSNPPAGEPIPVPAAPLAPIAPQAFVAVKLPSLGDVTSQVGAIVASLAQVGKANVTNLKGDKGAAIRDLIAHNVAAMKSIEAMDA